MTDDNIIPFDATFVEDLSAPLSETEIATQSIAQLTARLKGADTIAQQLQHVINTDIATKFGMVLESDDRQWFNITKKDLVGDTSDYATSWKHCRKQFTDQRKADGSTNVTMDFTRLQEKGRKIAEDADIAERVAAGETIEDTGSEVKSKGANTNKERDFDVALFLTTSRVYSVHMIALSKKRAKMALILFHRPIVIWSISM